MNNIVNMQIVLHIFILHLEFEMLQAAFVTYSSRNIYIWNDYHISV